MPESKEHQLHPLTPLQPDEIRSAVRIIKQHNVNQTYKLQFKGIILHEPPRKLVIDFLKAEQGGKSPQDRPPRIVRLHFYFLQAELPLHEAEVDVTNGKLIYQQALAAEFHGSTDEAEQILLTEIAMQSQEYKQEIQRLKLPEGTKVVGESWMYGTDSDVDERRKYQIYFYIAGLPNHPAHPQFNHYSLPLDFTVIIDCITHKIERVERLPRTFDGGYPDDGTPWDAAEPVQYAQDLVGPLRADLKPIQVIQPEGPSFKIDGNRVSWQKWSFLVGFNYREGPTVHTITYDGRPIMYRASLSEMTVPYTDPRSPYHRKSAFDLGDCGGGLCTNSLSLGCDCLGTIAYFPGYVYSSEGEPVTIDNAVCMHEVDTGVSWKHTNFRNGQATVVRGRELVLQSIFTLANYEYAVYFIFDTAAAFHVEVKATGIMSTNPTQANQLLCDYGLVVGPGVFAPSHQHLFNFRFDMAVDGWDQTSVAYEETHPMAKDEKNIHGIGARYTSTKVEKASHLDANPHANRIVKFYNPNKINPICGKPVAYKFAPMATQMLLAHPTSHHARRAEFAHHHMSFTKSADLELFSGGEFTNQGRGGHGLLKWVERGDDLAGQPVLWHTIGMTHNPRMEDWPVMPQETMRLSFKPANFFDRNPAWDVPSSTQRSTASVKAACNAANVVNGVNGVNGSTSSH